MTPLDPSEAQQAQPPAPAADAPATGAAATPQTPASLVKRLGPAALLGVGALVLPPLGGIALLTYMDTISHWLRGHQELGVVLYVVCFMVLAGLALLPTYAQAILGGWAFGLTLGLPAALAGFTGGALLGYLIAGRVTGDRVDTIIREKPAWAAVRDALVGSGFWKTLGIVALVRTPPNSPFALTNLVLSSSKTPWLPFVLGTLIGMTPRTAAAISIGHGLQTLTRENAGTRPEWWIPAGIGATLVVVVIIGHIAKKALAKVTRPAMAGAGA